MSIPKYYLSLINPKDANDAIRKLCIPSYLESDANGNLDTSDEKSNTVITGLQHKYKQTALILSTNKCAMYCRHCFRRRLVGLNDNEVEKQFVSIINYIKEHKEINNVLISGGDAFLNKNSKIEAYLKELVEIDHIDLIRFGTRTPVVFPSRINEDPELVDILRRYSNKKAIYVVTHYNHPTEVTYESRKAIECLHNAGIIIKNQTVLLKDVNNDPAIMSELMSKLTSINVIPYYIFQCRPVKGVKNQFQVPLKQGYEIISETRKRLNGQAKCFKYILSNQSGKIEILGTDNNNNMIFKYHQAKYTEDEEKIFVLKIDDNQCWI